MQDFHQICGQKKHCMAEVLNGVIQLAVEIAREGREAEKSTPFSSFLIQKRY